VTGTPPPRHVPTVIEPDADPDGLAAGRRGGTILDGRGAVVPVARLWWLLSLAAAVIAAMGSIFGLVAAQRIYGRETTGFIDQAVAQDVVNLAVVAPLTVVLGIRARRGSVRAYTCWLGCLAFTAYSYAIYAFSIHFGPLFLAWLAVLGLSFYALLGSLTTVDTTVVARWFGNREMPVTGWTLIIAAAAFGLLWLSGILPDLLAGRASASAAALNLPTNPVHVLDLALFLPAVLASGTLLLRRRPLGYVTAPGVLTFLILTCLPVLVTPLMSMANGRDPAWGALAPLGLVFVAATGVLCRTLRRPGSTSAPEPGL
jgi:hypothetical protein